MQRRFSKSIQSALSRRDLLRLAGLGVLGGGVCNWLPVLAGEAAADKSRKRQCILLWMSGGPTQTDTFDMKPGHANGGQFKEIATSVPGLRFSEHLPKLAKNAEHLAIIRSLSTKEGDHGRGTYLMRTGQQPGGPLRYPSIGAALSKELGDESTDLPSYVSIAPFQAFNPDAYGPGFLGPRFAPTTVGTAGNAPPDGADNRYAQLGVDYLHLPPGVTAAQDAGRRELWTSLQTNFLKSRRVESAQAHDTVYRRALRIIGSEAVTAFELDEEPDVVRDAYGRSQFGQGCLMARRLIERGVAFVEVALGGFDNGGVGWDTHQNNFAAVRTLSEQLDAGWGTLMTELKERGLLDTTTIIWMGEFGRTPAINDNAGRDHFPNAWTCVLAGGGVKGGQAYGKTSESGEEVEEGKTDVGNVLSTLCRALGVNPRTENYTPIGRPIKISDAEPIEDLLT